MQYNRNNNWRIQSVDAHTQRVQRENECADIFPLRLCILFCRSIVITENVSITM